MFMLIFWSSFKYLLIMLASVVLYYAYSFVKFLWKLYIFGKAADQFPMDKKHWLKGHLNMLSGPGEDGLLYLLQLLQKYPRACGLYLINFLRPYVLVYHPETVKVVMKASTGKPITFGTYGYGKQWFGDGLVLSNGEKWLRNRRLLTPTFHYEALKHYVEVYNEASDIFLNKLSACSRNNEEAEIQKLSTLLTFDIILRCVLSYQSKAQDEGVSHFYIKAVGVVSRLWMKRHYQPWKHFDCIYWRTSDGKNFMNNCKIIHGLADDLIKERRELLAEHPDQAKNYHDFLDMLMRSKDEDGIGLTNVEIRDEVNSFIASGYETTAGAIAWTLYSLASNPIYQKRCQDEIDELVKDRSDEYLSWKDIQELPYLTMCIKESLRLYCLPMIEKELNEDVIIDGKLIPAGMSVLVILFNLHRHPEIWNDPMTFDPERFSEQNNQNLNPFAYLPFSAGNRNCIGQAFGLNEIIVVLGRTLRRFDLTTSKMHTPMKRMAITMRSTNGIYLNVTERKQRNIF